jgi:streptogramin lyase
MLIFALLLACSGDDAPEPRPTDDSPEDTSPTGTTPGHTASDTGTDTDTDPHTGDTRATPTGSTGDTGPAPIDCANLPTRPLSAAPVPGARAYHGLVITDAGTIVGTDSNNLLEADGYGAVSVLLPGTGSMEQLDRFADGTIVGARTNGDILQIVPGGGSSVIASVGNTYGVRVGPDDKVYVADWERITRIDPATGSVETWFDGGNQFSPKVLDFNIDFTKLYVGSIYDSGNVYEFDLDANYDPVGNPRLLASTPGSWHDGLRVDICGNLYVAEYVNRAMYRISPSGAVSTLFIPPDSSWYGHGLVFGNGAGPFRETALYIPQPYNNDTVAEVEIGVPYRTYTGPVINGP